MVVEFSASLGVLVRAVLNWRLDAGLQNTMCGEED